MINPLTLLTEPPIGRARISVDSVLRFDLLSFGALLICVVNRRIFLTHCVVVSLCHISGSPSKYRGWLPGELCGLVRSVQADHQAEQPDPAHDFCDVGPLRPLRARRRTTSR